MTSWCIETRRIPHTTPPAHHLVADRVGAAPQIVGFRNPWASWHKPSVTQVIQGLEWGERDSNDESEKFHGLSADQCSSANGSADAREKFSSTAETFPTGKSSIPWPLSLLRRQNPALLGIQEPDFGFGPRDRARATWLGHAGVLVQLPGTDAHPDPLTLLFDPIFSTRCSPSQLVGPSRYFPTPCTVDELPPIDFVFISHNHYDHLDYNTILALWRRFGSNVHFFVPLGNKAWFTHEDPGIAEENVIELDWWDHADIYLKREGETSPITSDASHAAGENLNSTCIKSDTNSRILRITCTPAQHGSGRTALDANHALWSSWMIEHIDPRDEHDTYRVFFGGDSGYRFHDHKDELLTSKKKSNAGEQSSRSSSLLSSGLISGRNSSSNSSRVSSIASTPKSSNSPIGSPLLLPQDSSNVVKDSRSSKARLRRDDSLSQSSILRRSGILSRQSSKAPKVKYEKYPACPAFLEIAQRLGSPDMLLLPVAVGATLAYLKSFDLLPEWITPVPRLSSGLTGANHMTAADAVRVYREMTRSHRGSRVPVCLAIHWGTFVTGIEEIKETMCHLEAACMNQDVIYSRSYKSSSEHLTFALVNHGQSIRV
ncbi:hypothetical protein MYAM1_000924 [Malassezia yamatoensis]|uniref:Metallo-beta-lactamase domain-containing protein n=1 Tax=Malassezia yamatoensis TaxID=253288 RepID=A0AAJ6CGF4_9BASI|nr:hypothetical protein MYAM1_000924 [Malassezia yamatoensis]